LIVAARASQDDVKRRAVVFAEYFPPYMSSDRRLFHLVSHLSDWTLTGLVTPPLRVLTRRCETALLPYGRNFRGRTKTVKFAGIQATYLSLPAWLIRMFENPRLLVLAYILALPILVFEAARQVREADPDLCVVGHPSFITGVVGIIAAKLNRKPVLLDYPDAWTSLAVETSGLRNSFAIATLRTIESFVARAADRIVVITNSLARYVHAMGATAPIAVVSNGAELDRFRPPVDEQASGDRFRVLFTGRLESWSGVREMADLVDAVVSRAGSVVEFHFVGDGGAAKAFQRQLAVRGLSEYCRFDGFQPYWLMPEIIATCDLALLLFPDTQTTRVSSPVKLFEYMAMGKPVIATNLPGVREAVGRGEAIIVDDLRSPRLADEVLRLMGSPAERARIGNAGMKLVNERFGWRHLSSLFEAEMNRAVLAARKPGTRALPVYSVAAAAPIPSANSASPP
jgi:glycosyltransferase involved in cell wall biosynthesis